VHQSFEIATQIKLAMTIYMVARQWDQLKPLLPWKHYVVWHSKL